MESWVGAAAACAGYFAKHWQNLVPDVGTSDPDVGCSNANEAMSLMRQLRDAAYACRQGKEKRMTQPATGLLDGIFCDDSCLSPGEVASTSALLSVSKFPDGIPRCTEDNECDGEISMLGNIGESCNRGLDKQTWEVSSSHGSQWGRKSIRSWCIRPQLLKPLNSLESCLMAQLYKGHAQVEQRVPGPILSFSTPTLRPFYVTDGSRIISKSSADSFDKGARGEKTMQQKDIFFRVNGPFGVPYLPKIEEGRGLGHQKLRRVRNQIGNAPSPNALVIDTESLRQGSSSGAVILYCGIFVGMLCTFIENRAEVENLKGRLKQCENLVEDLQEELEMKDSLTVKELVKDGGSLLNANACIANDGSLMADTTECDSKEEGATKRDSQEADAQDRAESMTNIEAELEAELERLELNIKESSLKRRLSDIMEMNPDSVAVSEIVHGELRADMVKAASGSSSTHDLLSSTSKPDATKQAVSPHDLCLRLHEVIRSRLEQRIMELEVALDESQKRVQRLESERAISWREYVRSESSSTQDSPMARPLVMNLAGEALDAYNEAYEVLGGINVARQDDDRLELDSDNRKKLYPFDDDGRESMGILHRDGHDEMANGSMLSYAIDEEAIRPDFRINWKSKESTPSMNEEKNSDDEDDAMGFLIRQLVEKARQGSPAVLQAHQAMVSLHRD